MITNQFTRSYAWPGRDSDRMKPESPIALGLRYGYDLTGIGGARLQLQASYHAQSQATIPAFAVRTSYVGDYYHSMELKNEGASFGYQLQWRKGIELGIGCEVRYEELQLGRLKASQTRSWLNGRAGWHVPMGTLQFVAGLEAGLALTNQKDLDSLQYAESSIWWKATMKRISPSGEAGLYAGLRF